VKPQSAAVASATPWKAKLKETLAALRREADPSGREELLVAAVEEVAAGEIPAVLTCVQSGNYRDVPDEFVKRLVRRWAGQEPWAAASWVERMPAGAARQEAVENVAMEWANHQASEAVHWARQLPGEAEQSAALIAIAYEVTRTEPREALQLVVLLPQTPLRDELICHAAMEWASRDAAGATQWARQLKDEGMRHRILSGVVLAWAEQDPVSAATMAATELPPGRVQADAVVGIVQRWAQSDQAAAAAWVGQFPEGDLRQTALDHLARPGPEAPNTSE
jgi:DNA-binding transcriptional regulator YbjK